MGFVSKCADLQKPLLLWFVVYCKKSLFYTTELNEENFL